MQVGEAKQDRRGILKLCAAGLLAWAGPGAVGMAAAAPVPVGRGLYLVDGWLLTEADLVRLELGHP